MYDRWAVPRPLPGASTYERRLLEAEAHYNRHQIANRWYECFSELRVVHHQAVPAAIMGWSEPPQIGRVELGPPTRFTVRPRPGLHRDHLRAISDVLAAAFEVDAVEIGVLGPGWLTVLMIEGAEDAEPGAETAPLPTTALPPSTEQLPAAPTSGRVRVHRPRNPLGPGRWRRPSGGPRTGC